MLHPMVQHIYLSHHCCNTFCPVYQFDRLGKTFFRAAGIHLPLRLTCRNVNNHNRAGCAGEETRTQLPDMKEESMLVSQLRTLSVKGLMDCKSALTMVGCCPASERGHSEASAMARYRALAQSCTINRAGTLTSRMGYRGSRLSRFSFSICAWRTCLCERCLQ
jgi:hypothetical protein